MRIWIESDNPNGYATGKRFSIEYPAPTVMAAGMAGDSLGHWHIHSCGGGDLPPVGEQPDKPPYRVPSMEEIRAIPWNGYNAISTFSGCGGSSLGYRMAGFRVLWASEFIETARDSYAANKSAGTILDGRDIRLVKPEDILKATRLREGELDLLDSSPPCASFSTAGKREDGWGKVKKYSETTQRVDDLFFEFARILRGLQPKTFIAENVSGLVKGTAKGYFLEILRELKSSGYNVEARLLDAQWLGVPQMRQRIIFQGIRSDLGLSPSWPTPLKYRYSVRDALPWIASLEHANGFNGHASTPASTVQAGRPINVETDTDISRFAIGDEWDRLNPGEQSDRYFSLVKADPAKPCPTVMAMATSSAATVTHPTEKRKFTIAELRRICGFPDDFVLTGTYPQQWERLGRAVPPVMMSHIARAVRDGVLTQIKEKPGRSRVVQDKAAADQAALT